MKQIVAFAILLIASLIANAVDSHQCLSLTL